MLAFTVRIIISDIQKTFKGFWIFIYFVLISLIIIGPFYTRSFHTYSYVIFLTFSVLLPQITKVFYVLPLGNSLLRKYLHLRSMLLALFFLLAGGIMVLISQIWTVPHVERGWLMIMVDVQICIILSFSAMMVTWKKDTLFMIIAMIPFIINLINSIILVHFMIQLSISIVCVILSEILLVVRLKRVTLQEYKKPIYGYFAQMKHYNEMQAKKLKVEK